MTRGSVTFIYRHIIFYCIFITLKWSITEIRLGLYSLTLTIGCLINIIINDSNGPESWLVSSFVRYRFAITLPFFGIIVNLQHFEAIFSLFQVIFGALTISVRCLALYPLNNGPSTNRDFFSCSWWDFPFWSTCLCLKVREDVINLGKGEVSFSNLMDCVGSYCLEPVERKNGLN